MRLIKDLDGGGGPGRPSSAGNACRMRHTTTREYETELAKCSQHHARKSGGTLLARSSVLTRGPAGPRLSRGSAVGARNCTARSQRRRSCSSSAQHSVSSSLWPVPVRSTVPSARGQSDEEDPALSARAAPASRPRFMGEFTDSDDCARGSCAGGFFGGMRPDGE